MIRRLTAMDVEAVLDIEKDCFKMPYNAEQYLYEFEDNPCAYIYGYYKEDQLIGFIDYWITFDCAQLCKIAVVESERNKGIASELMEYMCKDAGKHGCESVLLEVRASNDTAKSFYEKFDFMEVNVRKKYYDNPVEDAIIMGKVLVGEYI